MNIARIRLRKPRRVLSFLCEDMALDRDDTCIVESDQGMEWGTCILPPEPCSQQIADKISMRVIRKATKADADSFQVLEQEERKAQKVCQEHIDKRALPMNLVDTEFTFDRHKITFFFTAENRVDFRELVRDLARELHSRIELRHIQVRDRSKVIGGLGCCGRVLCCTSWLDEFVPISMRMAKCQNLSLNPGKISGQCGRLLCCLNYENEVYEKGEMGQAKPAPQADAPYNEKEFATMEDDTRRRPDRQQKIVVAAPEPVPQDDAAESAQAPKGKRKKRKKKRGKGNAS